MWLLQHISRTVADVGGLLMVTHMASVSGTVRLDERGRLLLPAALRHRLGMRPGDELVLSEEAGGALRLESRRSAARALIGLAGSLDHSAVDDLRTERRHDMSTEQADEQRPRS